jgi:RimJ/RimL family protein N-acetyltransferase
MSVRLVDVRGVETAVDLLWQLLSERPPEASISHRRMPTREEHARFVAGHPYRCWYLIEEPAARRFVGACYLSRQNEMGIAILKAFQRRGFARAAVLELLRAHPPLPAIAGERRGTYVANVAPQNAALHDFFQGLGGRLIQHTYEITQPPHGD